MAEDYFSLSPYSYCAGNPIACRDENREWINFVIGGATDYALQVATNFAEGKRGAEVWTDVKGASIGVSFLAGAAGVGIATKIKQTMKVAKLARIQKELIKIGSEVAVDATGSAVNQFVVDSEIDSKDVAIDVAAGLVVNKTVSHVVQIKLRHRMQQRCFTIKLIELNVLQEKLVRKQQTMEQEELFQMESQAQEQQQNL